MRLLVFSLSDRRFAVAASSITEMVRAVAITPLPHAPAVIEGVIDVRGRIVPVYDLRRRFGLPAKPLEPADHFVLANAGGRVAALHVDRVHDLADAPDEAISSVRSVTRAGHIPGAVTLEDGLVLIHDVETFLTAAEAEALDAALASRDATVPAVDA